MLNATVLNTALNFDDTTETALPFIAPSVFSSLLDGVGVSKTQRGQTQRGQTQRPNRNTPFIGHSGILSLAFISLPDDLFDPGADKLDGTGWHISTCVPWAE